MQAVKYFHSRKLVHRDLKLENIVISDSDKLEVKIVDFGISGFRNEDKTNYGSLHYMSPETLKHYQTSSDTPIDIWSLGVILFTMVFGKYPFEGRTRDELRKNMKAQLGDFKFPKEPETTPEFRTLLGKMLRLDPSIRISSSQILYDPWIRLEINSEERLKREEDE